MFSFLREQGEGERLYHVQVALIGALVPAFCQSIERQNFCCHLNLSPTHPLARGQAWAEPARMLSRDTHILTEICAVEQLGGKGANLCEMARIGLNVPPGFTIATSVCKDFYVSGT